MVAKNFLYLTIFLFTFISPAYSGEGYRLEITVEGIQDTTLLLGYHYGERQFIKDTAMVNTKGHAVFEGKEKLQPGMYLVILPGSVYFEIIVDHHQHFSVYAHKEKIIESLRFEGSPDNTRFYEYIRFLQQVNQHVMSLRQRLELPGTDPDTLQEITLQIQQKEKEVAEKQHNYITDFPDGLFSRVLLAQRTSDMSDLAESAEHQDDPNFMYRMYKERFWDHIDFSDDRIIRTPVYHAMLNRFINQFIIQIPDTIIVEADLLLKKARVHDEMFRYTLWYLTNNAERSQVMGMDAVFVHLVENYYNKGDAFWMTAEGLERLSKRASQLAPLLIGQKAPAIYGFDTKGQRLALNDVKADFLIIYFWESECAHCRKETPILRDLYEKYKSDGFEVFAMNVETEQEKWLGSIANYGLKWINVNDIYNRSGFRDKYDVYAIPLIYLLDKDKRIIAKKISADQIDGFMEFELNRRKENN